MIRITINISLFFCQVFWQLYTNTSIYIKNLYRLYTSSIISFGISSPLILSPVTGSNVKK